MTEPNARSIAVSPMEETSLLMQETGVIGKHSSGELETTAVFSQKPQEKRMDDQEPSPEPKTGEPSKSSGKGTSHLGKYKLIKKLGQGGMGEVFLAEDTKLGRKSAIKVLSKQLAGKEDYIQRFYREARSMAKVTHENVVSVYDVDQDRGIHFVAMEFVDGKSLQKWMDELGQLSVGDALHVTLRCAEALHVAHSQSMVHRDIKPDNLMLTSKGKVKVADFGLAKATDEDMSLTQSGTGLGTPYYMAPEQARNAKHVDGRADIYALGVTLYYFVTGKQPFSGNSALEVVMSKEKGLFTAARKLNPQVPERLDMIIDKMIAKDLNTRCKDCVEVIKLLSGLGLESPSLSFIDAPDKVVQTSTSAGSSSSAARGLQSSTASPRSVVSSGIPQTSAQDAAARAKPVPASVAGQTWFVQYRNPQGKGTVAKLTTVQLQSGLQSGTLGANSKCKKNASDQFMPLAHFGEFQRQVEGRLIKDRAEKQSCDMKAAYAKIDRQYDSRGWKRWFHNVLSGIYGFISLIIWLSAVVGLLVGVWIYREPIWNIFSTSVNKARSSLIPQSTSPTAENPAK